MVRNEGPLVQKAGKRVPLSALKYRAFSFLPWSLSISHDAFYLLFNVMLNKEKLKYLIISMHFTIHLYMVQWQFQMQKEWHLTCMWNHQTTQLAYCSSYMHMYFVLTRTVETLHVANSTETNSTLKSYFLIHAYSTNVLWKWAAAIKCWPCTRLESLNSHTSQSVLMGRCEHFLQTVPQQVNTRILCTTSSEAHAPLTKRWFKDKTKTCEMVTAEP